MPHRARLEDLNKARVAFKHSGTSPSKADARRLVGFGLEFLEVATPRLVGIEYAKISLCAAVRNDEIRGLLIGAQAMLAEERWRDAMIEAADAVTLVRVGAHQPLGPGLRGCRLPRPCVGLRRSFGSAPAPAGAARCPHGSGSNPSPRPSQGRERVALCRQRCQAINGQTPHTASVVRRDAASRPSPSGGLTASLDPAACRKQR